MDGRYVLAVLVWINVLSNTAQAEELFRGPDCQRQMRAFLAMPTELSLSFLEEGVNAEKCWQAISSANKDLDRLDRLTERGNIVGAQYLAQHLKQLDGGNLEDSLIALGMFAKRHPEDFLSLSKDGTISDRELVDSLTMLPSDLTDNLKGQAREMRVRRERIAKVGRSDLQEKKGVALKGIDDHLAELISHL